MKCPKCNSDTNVLDSRQRKGYNYRRRVCLKCKHRFLTFECEARHFNYKKNQLSLKSTVKRIKEFEEKEIKELSRKCQKIKKDESKKDNEYQQLKDYYKEKVKGLKSKKLENPYLLKNPCVCCKKANKSGAFYCKDCWEYIRAKVNTSIAKNQQSLDVRFKGFLKRMLKYAKDDIIINKTLKKILANKEKIKR